MPPDLFTRMVVLVVQKRPALLFSTSRFITRLTQWIRCPAANPKVLRCHTLVAAAQGTVRPRHAQSIGAAARQAGKTSSKSPELAKLVLSPKGDRPLSVPRCGRCSRAAPPRRALIARLAEPQTHMPHRRHNALPLQLTGPP